MKVLVLALILLAAPSARASVEVERIFGPVVGAGKAGARKLSERDKLREGEELTTGNDAAADLRFESMAFVRVGRDSVARLDTAAQPEGLWLVKGTLRVLVPKKENGPSSQIRFRVLTPDATLLVAGTEFFVELRDCKTLVKGLDGTVYVGAASDAKAKALPAEGGTGVRVGRSFMTEIDACGQGTAKPTKPEKFDLQGTLTELNKAGGKFLPEGFGAQKARGYQRGAPVTK